MSCVHTGNGTAAARAEQIMGNMHPTALTDHLRDLHEQYVDAVNRAVAEDRDDLVRGLADDYTDRAVALLEAAA